MADTGTTDGSSYLFGFAGGAVNKESVMEAIVLTSPFDTPLLQMAPKVPAVHTTEEWLEDTLTAVAITGEKEGRDFSGEAIVAPVRKTNWTQIFGKDLHVSMTQMHLKSYGFTDTMAREVLDGTREVMRNIENKIFAVSGAQTTTTVTAARLMKTLQDFIISNRFGVTHTSLGGALDAQLSASALHEVTFNTLLQKVYEDGGNPNFVFVPPATKRAMSAWQGSPTAVATTAAPVVHNLQQGGTQLGRAVTSYLSDFAMLNIVLDRWVPQAANTIIDFSTSLGGAIFLLDLAKVEIAFLRPIAVVPMATRGDHVQSQITGELTIRVLAQAHMGVIQGISNLRFAA